MLNSNSILTKHFNSLFVIPEESKHSIREKLGNIGVGILRNDKDNGKLLFAIDHYQNLLKSLIY
ncbi:hypothetical protein QE422_003916 [Chryseobacterium sp. SORGH_AS 447]|nr:hypothetical protein [Chryseobacterium sp. SORGH_AS_0447]